MNLQLRPNSDIHNPSNELYKDVLRKYLNTLQPPPVYENHITSKKLAVMIEPRYDEITMAVLYNFMHFMAPQDDPTSEYSQGWNFMFISYSGNEMAVKQRFPNMKFIALDEKYIEMRQGVPNITIQSYNEILMSMNFWSKTIPDRYEKVCIFQRDCIMYRPFSRIYEMYSFAGATYGDIITDAEFLKSTTFFSGGINGGFSIRNRAHMIMCIHTITVDHIKKYREVQASTMRDVFEAKYGLSKKRVIDFNFSLANEDVYFINACEILGLLMPDLLHCDGLAIEMSTREISTDKTSVYHGWDKSYHSRNVAIKRLGQTELFAAFVAEETKQIPKVVNEQSKTSPVYVLPENLCD